MWNLSVWTLKAYVPSQGKSCNTCGKLNHFSARCPNRNAQRSTQYVPQRRDRDRGKRPKSYNVKQLQASNEDDISEDTDTDETTDEDCDFVNKVTVFGVVTNSCVDSVEKDWTQKCTINGRAISFKLDTGAQTDIIPENVVALLGVDSLQSNNVTLKSYSKAYVTIGQNPSDGARKGIRGSNLANILRCPADRAPIGHSSGKHPANLTRS